MKTCLIIKELIFPKLLKKVCKKNDLVFSIIMDQPSISFIPNEDIDDYLDSLPTPTNRLPLPPALPEPQQPEDVTSLLPPPTAPPPQGYEVAPPYQRETGENASRQRRPRIRVETTTEQLECVQRLFEEHHDTLSPTEICTRARLSKPTASRLLKRLRNGRI